MITTGVQMLVKTKLLNENATLPTRATDQAAGLDIYSSEDKIVPPFGIINIKTGIAMEYPPYTVNMLLSRSSMAKKGLVLVGGVIDSDYRGEIEVMLYNTTIDSYLVEKGHKIAQLVIFPIVIAHPYQVEVLSETQRGTNGFGSTGV